MEPGVLDEPAEVVLPEVFPLVWLPDLEVGDEVVEPVFDFELAEVLRLPEPELPVLELLPDRPELESDMMLVSVLLLLLVFCALPDIIEEEELFTPDWFVPEVDFESEPEPDIED